MRAFAVRLRPRASGTIDTLFLIELKQSMYAAHDTHLAPSKLRRRQRGLRAAGDFADGFDVRRRGFFRRLSGRSHGAFASFVEVLVDSLRHRRFFPTGY